MLAVLGGGLAAAVVYGLNRRAARVMGEKAITVAGPAIEELAKTLASVLLGAPLVETHLAFGVIEAVYDMSQGTRAGAPAVILSTGGHTLFGIVTYMVTLWSGSWQAGTIAAVFAHAIWNRTILSI